MTFKDRFNQLRTRLLAIFSAQREPLWPSPESMPYSAILSDIRAEWSVHYITVLETINAAALEVESWYNNADRPSESKDRLVELPLHYLEQSCGIFEVDLTEKYIELLSTIAEAAARITGVDLAVTTFELINMLRRVRTIASLEHSEAVCTDSFLRVVEESMRRMLLNALLVETQAGSLTGRFQNYERVDKDLIEAWKRPIISRVRSARQELNAKGRVLAVTFEDQGLWPNGLQ